MSQTYSEEFGQPDSRRWRWAFVAAILALLVSGGLAIRQYARFSEATGRVEHTYQVITNIDDLRAALVDAETGQRGFVLTNSPDFLAPFVRAAPRIAGLTGQLESLVTDNAQQADRARRLRQLANEKLDELRAVLDLFQRGQTGDALARVTAGEGRRVMEDIRRVSADMRSVETSMLDQRAVEARLARRASVGFGFISLMMAASLALAASAVSRSFEHRRAALERETSKRRMAEESAASAERELAGTASLYRSILDNSGNCIQVLEPDGRLASMNKPGLAMMQIDDFETFRGRPWTDLWGPNRHLAASGLSAALANGEARFQGPCATAKGSPRWWDVMITPIRDPAGEVSSIVCFLHDITEQKRAEDERNQLLASERAARSEAERAAQIKDEFLSTLSHELRTPLNAIVGWVSVLKQDQTHDTMVKAVDVIDRNSRRQSQMIDDLLDVSRIVSGKLRLDIQRVDLGAVIEEAIASAQPGADAKGVRMVRLLGTPALVQGDPVRLQQVVWNLVSNAIKFSSRGGAVQVTLGRSGSHAQLQVSDTGQGIAPELLPYVFQRFRQGDSSATRRHGGLGLGLAIVENLVEMHGGSVEATSDGVGQGAQFIVRLPLALATSRWLEVEVQDSPAPIGELLRGVVAMVIDDEPDARDLVQRLLEDAGASVSAWNSAEEALQSIRDGFVPDVIVSDVGMPDHDGYDFISRVRQLSGPAAAVPAAALTAMARVQDRRRALLAGYQTHLAKPVDPAELVATVASLARRTGLRRDS